MGEISGSHETNQKARNKKNGGRKTKELQIITNKQKPSSTSVMGFGR